MIEEIKQVLGLAELADVSPSEEAAKLLSKIDKLGPAVDLIVWNFDLTECPAGEKVLVSTDESPGVAQVSQRFPNHWVYVKGTPLAWAPFPKNVLELLS